MKLSGKKALVTGSSQGIGQAIAFRLAKSALTLLSITTVTPKQQRNHPGSGRWAGNSVCIQAEIRSVVGVQNLIQKSIEALGGFDILVNNAGVEKRASFWEVTEGDYDLVLNTNLEGAFFATQAFVKHRMQVKQPGKVINNQFSA
jgi:glucose 1-dehydrogenase